MRVSFFLVIVLFIACNKHAPVNEQECLKNFNIADKLYDDGKKQEAFHYIDSTLGAKATLPYGKSLYYNFKIRYCNDSALYNRSLAYADSNISILRANNFDKTKPEDYIHALLDKANICSDMGRLEEAKNFYLQGYLLAEKAGSACSLSEYSYLIAMTLYRQNKYGQAIIFFKRAYHFQSRCSTNKNTDQRQQEILGNIGLSYNIMHKPDSAIFYYDAGLAFLEKNALKFTAKALSSAKAVLYKNKAVSELNCGRLNESEQFILKSIELNKQGNNDRDFDIKAGVKLVMLYSEQKNFPAMYKIMNSLKQYADSANKPEIQFFLKETAFRYYANLRQFEKAYNYLYIFHEYRDSINNADKALEQVDVVRDLKEKEQSYKISLLTKESEVQHLFLLITIGFSLFAIVIILLVYILYKKGRENIKTLKSLNIKINEQKAALEKSNSDKDRILQVVAHDLRSPIGAVVYMLDMVQEDLEDGDKTEQWDLIKSTLNNTLSLTDELLAYKKDAELLVKEQVEINTLVNRAVMLMQGKATGKEQVIIYEALQTAINLNIDPDKISRVLQNLIGNAIKFSDTGRQIIVKAIVKDDKLIIAVKDNGIGIPANLQPQLFDLFTVAKRKGTSGEQSHGLGLSICRQIIEAHGGTIAVESSVDKGSIFTIELPIP